MCTSYNDGVQYFNSLRDFNQLMEDPVITDRCTHECLPNCEEVTYDVVMDTTYLQPNHLCQEEETRKVRVFLVIFN